MSIKYYRCRSCNLTFKNLESAIDHKASTNHNGIEEERYGLHYEPFPASKTENVSASDSRLDLLPSKGFVIGEPSGPQEGREVYVCLSCRLTFKDRTGAVAHSLHTWHKVIRENYPIDPSHPASFERTGQIVGSNIDYDAFFQRTLDDVPNED